jgi:bifunctional polynucleotide phosphatase/kinase
MNTNPVFMKCINNIKDGPKVLDKLNIVYENSVNFKKHDTVFYYEPGIKKFDYVAVFDLDWTLTYNEQHLFPREIDDIKIFPNRRKKLEDIIKLGYTIVIFTNQYAKSKAEKQKKVDRITTFIKELKLPVFVYISTEKDDYRKPNIGMWNLFMKDIPNVKNSIFVGDALGRPEDFSDSDKVFAENIKTMYIYSPEYFFGSAPIPSFKKYKELIVFVGMPGCGKNTYYNKYLSDHVSIEQDVLKNRKKMLEELDKSLKTGNSIVINSTNPLQENRLEYYKKALKYDYNIKVLYFLVNGTGFNKLREKPISSIVYHIYFKNLEPPTYENTPGEVFYVY